MNRAALKLVVLEAPATGEPGGPAPRRGASLRCTYKSPGDDFYCWKFQIWYPSIDCAYRVQNRTCSPCSNCAQGRRNLERRAEDLSRRRWIGDPES